jgi:putative FmdB family regulatory protein
MPLYEYKCAKCGHVFEVVQKAGAPPLKKCPKCAGLLRKLLSAPAIHFKGSGWYVTDYAKKTSGGADKPPAKKGESADAPKPADAKDAKKDDGPSKP